MRPLLAAMLAVSLLAVRPALACQSDNECKGDRICVAGTCTAPAASALKACAVDKDCPGDLVCEQAVCAAPVQPTPAYARELPPRAASRPAGPKMHLTTLGWSGIGLAVAGLGTLVTSAVLYSGANQRFQSGEATIRTWEGHDWGPWFQLTCREFMGGSIDGHLIDSYEGKDFETDDTDFECIDDARTAQISRWVMVGGGLAMAASIPLIVLGRAADPEPTSAVSVGLGGNGLALRMRF